MTNNQLAENSVNQLLNTVRLARDNAERADNRVDHSFYYALTIALEELQERRKAAEGYKNLNEMEQRAEQAECLIMCLDDLGVPNTEGSESLSLWGRVKIFAEENSKDRAELQERRQADSEPAMYVMGMGQALDAETASTCKGAVDSWVAEWNQSRLPGQADYKTVPLYRHAQPAPVVPEEMTPQQASRSYGGEVSGYRDGWNACRAAMLQTGPLTSEDTKQAEPVTTANKFVNSPVIPDGWKVVPPIPTSAMYFATNGKDSLTEKYIAMLEAAPELPGLEPAAPQEVRKSNVIDTYQGADGKDHPIIYLSGLLQEVQGE